MNRILTQATVTAALFLVTGAANAETFRARLQGTGLADVNNSSVYYDATGFGNTSLSLGPLTGQGTLGPTTTTATSSATASLSGDHLLGLFTSTDSTGNAVANSFAFGAYRDILTISGVQTLPTSVRITFLAHAAFDVTPHVSGGDGGAGLSVGFLGYDEQTAISFNMASVAYSPGGGLFAQGFESFSGTNESFTGRFSLLTTFDQARGGYSYQMAGGVSTSAFAALSSANALNTFSLLSITNADGSEISGASFTFDSGLQTTPEPGTAALAGLCLVTLVLARFRYTASSEATAGRPGIHNDISA